MSGATVQKNKLTGQIRSVVGREPGGVSPLEKKVQQLGTALEKAGLPQSDAVLLDADNAVKTTPELAEYLTGAKSYLPDAMVPEKVRYGRQAFEKLFNITLKDRSGAAVTNQELERLKKEYARGLWKTPEQIQKGLDQARSVITAHYLGIAAGFGKEALGQYNQNLQEVGGRPVNTSPTQATLPSGIPSGSKIVGKTAQGVYVYEAPDGKRYTP